MLALALLAAAPAPLSAVAEGLKLLHSFDLRISVLTDRLAISGIAYCSKHVPRMGLIFEDAALYQEPERSVAGRLYGLKSYPMIVYPQNLAGTEVFAIDGQPIWAVDPKNLRSRIDQIEKAAEQAATMLNTLHIGQVAQLPVSGPPGCPSRAQVIPARGRLAKADGEIIQIGTATIQQTKSDDELAFVIAHEMAHNILGHQALLDWMGRKPATIRATEIDADRLGLKLMKAAGFDPHAAATFWARYGRGLGEGILSDGSHMRGKERVAFLSAEAAKLKQ